MSCAVNSFCSWVNSLLTLINPLIALASAIALTIFFWGLVKYVYAAGSSEAHTKGKELIVWGLVALFVIFSLWGIIRFFSDALLPAPNSYYTGGAPT